MYAGSAGTKTRGRKLSILSRMADSQGHEIADPGGVNTTEFDIQQREPGRSHRSLRSVAVAMWLDWICLGVVVVIGILVQFLAPTFQAYVDQTALAALNFPLRSDTVPTAVLPVISLAIPLLIFLSAFCWQREWKEMHHASLGLFLAVASTWLLTNALKLSVGRPRPDFGALCFQGAPPAFGSNGNVVCTSPPSAMHSARQSFPSGHTSLSFAGMAFLSTYLAGKVRSGDGKGHLSKLLLVLLPLAVAVLVGVSRLDDYKHHWQDVVAGALIGICFARLFYVHFFHQASSSTHHDVAHPIPNEAEPITQLPVSFPSTTPPQDRTSTFPTEVHPHGRFDDRNLPRDSSATTHRGPLSLGDPDLPKDGDSAPLNELGIFSNVNSFGDGHMSIPETVSSSSYRTAPPSFSNSGLIQRGGGGFGMVSEIVAHEL